MRKNLSVLFVRAFVQSVEGYLRGNNYGLSVSNDKEFHEVQVFCNFVLRSAFVLRNSSICI